MLHINNFTEGEPEDEAPIQLEPDTYSQMIEEEAAIAPTLVTEEVPAPVTEQPTAPTQVAEPTSDTGLGNFADSMTDLLTNSGLEYSKVDGAAVEAQPTDATTYVDTDALFNQEIPDLYPPLFGDDVVPQQSTTPTIIPDNIFTAGITNLTN